MEPIWEDAEKRALPTTPLPADPVPAMAYVPFQQYGRLFSPERALEAGTLFPELEKPFCPGKGGARP